MSYRSHARRNSVGGPGAKPPGKAGGFGGPRGPPNRGMVEMGGTVNYSQWVLGDGTISGDGQGWNDVVDPKYF